MGLGGRMQGDRASIPLDGLIESACHLGLIGQLEVTLSLVRPFAHRPVTPRADWCTADPASPALAPSRAALARLGRVVVLTPPEFYAGVGVCSTHAARHLGGERGGGCARRVCVVRLVLSQLTEPRASGSQ